VSKKSGRGLVIKDKKILLIKRYNHGEHYYTIPGGKKEKGESIEDSIIREVFEETGIKVKTEVYLGKGRSRKRKHYLYLCSYQGGHLTPENRSETTKTNTYNPVWLDINTVANSVVQPKSLRKYVANYLKDSTNTLNSPSNLAAKNIK